MIIFMIISHFFASKSIIYRLDGFCIFHIRNNNRRSLKLHTKCIQLMIDDKFAYEYSKLKSLIFTHIYCWKHILYKENLTAAKLLFIYNEKALYLSIFILYRTIRAFYIFSLFILQHNFRNFDLVEISIFFCETFNLFCIELGFQIRNDTFFTLSLMFYLRWQDKKMIFT